jgi:hypothetical protein
VHSIAFLRARYVSQHTSNGATYPGTFSV